MMYSYKFVTSIKSNGKILRESDDQVVLPFQSEYSIVLKNLESRKATVKVSIDGIDVLYGKSIIINPNETIELERFVDNLSQGNKFKFIKKTSEISDYRGDRIDDGLVRVEFTFEKPAEFIFPFQMDTRRVSYSYDKGYKINNVTWANSISEQLYTSALNNNVEDGITVQGSKSSQQFKIGTIGILEENSHVMVIRLKGSDKITEPVTVKTKIKCSTCGKYSKGNFCYNCGTSLIKY